jgi:hypothetical protein
MIMDKSRDYSITVKINVMYLTGRCTGVGKVRVGQVCSAIGRAGLPFPREGCLLFCLEELDVDVR